MNSNLSVDDASLDESFFERMFASPRGSDDGNDQETAPPQRSEKTRHKTLKLMATFSLVVCGCAAVVIVSLLAARANNESKSEGYEEQPFQDLETTPFPNLSPSDLPSLRPSTTTPESNSLSNAASSAPSSASEGKIMVNVPTATSGSPSSAPSAKIAAEPSEFPSLMPSMQPSNLPSLSPNVTYIPGDLTKSEAGLLLSTGLTARIIARSGEIVSYDNVGQSSIRFHRQPDFGATFDDPNNPGGWIYVNNKEDFNRTEGGVGALRFDPDGKLTDYKMVLEGSTGNCGGGRTPWGAWISCEEYRRGVAWQVDPTGARAPQAITLGRDGGWWESFAYDVRNRARPRFFITEDRQDGPVRRFIPTAANWSDPWNMLLGEGEERFLLLLPDDETYERGRFVWTTNLERARQNAYDYYANCEGIDYHDGQLYFVSKVLFSMFNLDLNNSTYTNTTTRSGLFNGSPDQLQRVLNDGSDTLYFTEEGGRTAGIHGRDRNGKFFTILEAEDVSLWRDETTGLAFSPNGRFLYVAFQNNGILYEVKREDGLQFQAKTLNVKHHDPNARRRLMHHIDE